MRRIVAVSVIGSFLAVLIIAGLPRYGDAATIYGCETPGSRLLRIVSGPGLCRPHEIPISWDSVGPRGPAGPTGPAGPAGPAGPTGPAGTTEIFFDRNCTAPDTNGCNPQPLAPFPGITVASLTLPPGSYVLSTKLRYKGLTSAGDPAQSASCVYQSSSGNIGGLDASVQDDVPAAGQVDGSMMDIFNNYTTGNVEVHVQCFGPSTVGIVNPQFSATPATLHIQ